MMKDKNQGKERPLARFDRRTRVMEDATSRYTVRGVRLPCVANGKSIDRRMY